MKMKAKALSILFLSLALGNCATIIGQETQTLPIMSSPEGAKVLIRHIASGDVVFRGTTPTQVTLDKHDGTYFGKKEYQVTLSLEGKQTYTVEVRASATGWYAAGNLGFGGLIGWLIVDPLNGGMYTLSPPKIRAVFEGNSGNKRNRSLSLVSLTDLPKNLRKNLVPLQSIRIPLP